MFPRAYRWTIPLVLCCAATAVASASTTITFTRAEVNEMALLWETDCVSISPLANAQYPSIAGTWDFIIPHTNISSDGDIHIDMAIDSAGTGSSGNNIGASPLVCEVVNATSSQLSHLDGMSGQQAMFRGIFRFYTEHISERHFELHPVTQLQRWNGSTFVADSDYHSNVAAVADGTTHPSSTLISLLDGSQTISATIAADNTNVTFNCPSPSVNYVQYDGVTVSGVQTDSLSQYFLFKPDLVPNATVRCRLVTSTAAATAAAGLVANQNLTVNALTRTDMAAMSSQISSMNAGQQKTFSRPIELIILGLPNIAPSPTPTPTPINGTFGNTSSIGISGANGGKGAPYPSTIVSSNLIGKVTKVTAQLNGISGTSRSDYASDLDIMMVGPAGQNVMLMSDAGGNHRLNNVTLGFDDAAAGLLSQTGTISSGTYKPTNYPGDNDAFPAPAPSSSPGALLSAFNNTDPNGTWSLFVLNEYVPGSGSIAGGWSITITTSPAPPIVSTNAASGVTSTTATLNGTIDPLGQLSTYQFQLGMDATYGFAQTSQPAGNATSAIPVSVVLSGLQPATTYHFRLIGANTSGSANGADRTFTTAAFVDSDGDGMPNDYETANGFDSQNSSDASADSDGDGMTNLQESIAGTNPRSAASVLRITSVNRSGSDIVITFPSVFGKTYKLEQTNTLGAPWSIVSDNIAGTGGDLSIADTEAADTQTQRFYRVSTP